jgi:hypothetical protein
MQAFAGVCAAMVASNFLQHTALRGIIDCDRLVHEPVPRELKLKRISKFRFECFMPKVCI